MLFAQTSPEVPPPADPVSEQATEEPNPYGDDTPDLGQSFSVTPLNSNPQMFFDAQSMGFTRDGNEQVFQGDVVAVGAGVLITADKVSMNRKTDLLKAEGHVIVLTENQIFLGDSIDFRVGKGDFKLVNAIMIANDAKTAETVSRRVLGFTPAEMAFEEQKVKRLAVLDERKRKLRENYVSQYETSKKEPEQALVDNYSLLLEQEDLTKEQENPFLSKMTQDRRRRYKARRLYWQKGEEETRKLAGRKRMSSYFRIDGKTITRQDMNDYEIDDAFWTPCMCEDDEKPAWGFRSSRMVGQTEGYLDFYHPILEIKGMPVLYIPFLKVPMKEKRQSGLLMPTFSQRSSSGNIYSQPIYFALRDDLDATLNAEIYEKRGTKLGLETRFQERKYSGWTLQLEGMRDRVWMDQRRIRDNARSYWFDNEEANIRQYCAQANAQDPNPNAEAQCLRLAQQHLSAPTNDWRGATTWRGLTFLAPRLSFVSEGKIYSDHRYVEDLTLYEDFQSALDPSSRATMFSTSRYRFHLDAKNFYAGVGGAMGDNVLSTDRFQGQQTPYQGSLQSRLINLDRGYSPVPIYAQVSGQHYQITDYRGRQSEDQPQLEGQDRTLGEGYWQRVKVDQVSPILTKGIFKLDQFFDWQARSIAHSGMSEPRSSIRSWRTGLTLNLPLDGEGALPNFFRAGNVKGEAFGSPFVRHYMNWAISFSIRPDMFRSGPYGEYRNQYYEKGSYKEGGELVYFASDRRVYDDNDKDIEPNDTMIRHKRIMFSTQHTWDFFDRGWERIPGETKPAATDSNKEPESYNERAKRELLDMLDRPVGSVDDMFDESRKSFFINRYRLEERNNTRIVEFNSDISYDFIDEKRREEEKKRRQRGDAPDTGQVNLPQPWSAPRSTTKINLFGSSLSNYVRYNLYYKRATDQTFSLVLPTFLKTKVTLGYKLGNEPEYNSDSGNLDFILTREQNVAVSTGIIPNVMFSTWLGRRTKDINSGPDLNEYQTIFGADYLSPSGCWRLSFVRQKEFKDQEQNAEYLLKLAVIFLAQERGYDISPGLERELPSKRNQ